MPVLSQDTVKHIAALARLSLSPEEVVQFQAELQKILSAFEALSNVALPRPLSPATRSGAAPGTEMGGEFSSVSLRLDEAEQSFAPQGFLDQVPDRDGNFVRVPQIIER